MSPFSAESSRSCSTPRAACGSPSSEIVKESRHEEHTLTVADARELWRRLRLVLAPDCFEGCRPSMPQASTLHQQIDRFAVGRCGCCGDPQCVSPTDIPPSPTARSQQPSTHSQHHRTSVEYYFTVTPWAIFEYIVIIM